MGIKTITLTWLLMQLVISSSDWKEVERDVLIPHNIEHTQLAIQTNSVVGGDEQVNVWLLSLHGEIAGDIVLLFTAPPKYMIDYCTTWITLPAHLPTKQDKVWKIIKRVEPRAVVITCNDVEVVNHLLSDSTCIVTNWDTFWSRHATKIWFSGSDTASDYYLSITDWKEVQRDVRIQHDTDSRQLVIQTNSLVGSSEQVRVYFYSLQGKGAGDIGLLFTSPPKYTIGNCTTSTPLPVHLPTQQDKVWKITKTVDPRVVVISCNDVEVVHFLMSDSTCTGYSGWDRYWSRHATQMTFSDSDTASDYYVSIPVIHGVWSDYGDWTECSQARARICNNPDPANGGKECEGEAIEHQGCNIHLCPVDGGCIHYGAWSECSADCDGGTQTRTMSCNNPAPANGGKECEGNSTQNQSCNTHLCPAKGSGDKNAFSTFASLTGVLVLTTVLSVGYNLYQRRIIKTHTSKTEIILS